MTFGKVLLTFLLCLSVAFGPTPTSALTIDFNSGPGFGNPAVTTLTTNGFTFTSAQFYTVNWPGICVFGGCVSNGTTYIGSLGLPITMTRSGGGTFSLQGFDAAQLFNDDAAAAAAGYGNAISLDVNGGAVPLSDPFLPYSFVLTNLTSVTFTGVGVSGGPGGFALDNIVVADDGLASAPEPGTLLLFGTAAGLGLARWRQQRKHQT